MPKSKRSKLVTLSKTEKKTREDKERIGDEIHNQLDEHRYAWVFSVANMRNTFLKTVRQDWKGSRLLFGRTKVMAKALGTSPDSAYLPNLDQLAGPDAGYMVGDVGLLLTDEPPETVREYFHSFVKTDYARAGLESPIGFAVPEGIVYSTGGRIPASEDVPMAHSLETTLRSLGMPTLLKGGKITLSNEYVVCKEGEVLNGKQTRLLKHFGVAVSDFKIKLLAYYDKDNGQVYEEENKDEDN